MERKKTKWWLIVSGVAVASVIALTAGIAVATPMVVRAVNNDSYRGAVDQLTSLRTTYTQTTAHTETAQSALTADLVRTQALVALAGEPVTIQAQENLRQAQQQAQNFSDATPTIDAKVFDIPNEHTTAAVESQISAATTALDTVTKNLDATNTADSTLVAAQKNFFHALSTRIDQLLSTSSNASTETRTALQNLGSQLATAGNTDADLTTAQNAVYASSALMASNQRTSSSLQTPPTSTQADVDAQLAYLHKHTFNYNLADFGNFNPVGGDCANFVSQGLPKRGWKMDSTWRLNAPGSATSAWIYVPAMDAYFKSLGLKRYGLDQLDKVKVGDVGVFSWGEEGSGADHVMTVSKIEQGPNGPVLYFVSHNNDGDYRELMQTLYVDHSNSTAWFYSIP